MDRDRFLHTNRRLETSDIFRGGAAAAGRAVDDPGVRGGGLGGGGGEGTPPGGRHLCSFSNNMAYITLNKIRSNCAYLLYVVSSRFLF